MTIHPRLGPRGKVDTDHFAAADGVCRVRACLECGSSCSFVFRNTAGRQCAVHGPPHRHFPIVVAGRIDCTEADERFRQKRSLESGAVGMSTLDEVHDLRLLHLCHRQFRHLRRLSRSNRKAGSQRSRPGRGLAWLLGTLDGFLFSRPGHSHNRLSPRSVEPPTPMSKWTRYRLERPVLRNMRGADRRPAELRNNGKFVLSCTAKAGHPVLRAVALNLGDAEYRIVRFHGR
jgi:hypothetical protein